jgi:predicted Zn-ribbon and HTH transcriptional regulator
MVGPSSEREEPERCPSCGAELLLDPDECDACGWPDFDDEDDEEATRDDAHAE